MYAYDGVLVSAFQFAISATAAMSATFQLPTLMAIQTRTCTLGKTSLIHTCMYSWLSSVCRSVTLAYVLGYGRMPDDLILREPIPWNNVVENRNLQDLAVILRYSWEWQHPGVAGQAEQEAQRHAHKSTIIIHIQVNCLEFNLVLKMHDRE